jgi:DnaK suppressor protein
MAEKKWVPGGWEKKKPTPKPTAKPVAKKPAPKPAPAKPKAKATPNNGGGGDIDKAWVPGGREKRAPKPAPKAAAKPAVKTVAPAAKTKVSQATIDSMKTMGMTKAIEKAANGKASAEFKEGAKRMYGQRRIDAAKKTKPASSDGRKARLV